MSNEVDDIVNNASKKTVVKIAQPEVHDTENSFQYTAVELPSKGKLGYDEIVEYRDIMVKDEKAIANATEKTFFTTLNTVLKGLLKDSSRYEEMSIFDRDFLLMWVWSNNYDTVKHITHTCSVCEEDSKYDVDVTELEITNIKDVYDSKYVHKFRSGKKFPIRLLTVRDEQIATKFSTGKNAVDDVYVMMVMSLDNGKTMSLKEKLKWADDNLSGKDMAEIRGFHNYFKFGIAESVQRDCTHCGEGEKISIPFQIDHFIPTIRYDFKPTV